MLGFEATLYKVIRAKAFGRYFSQCGMTLTPVVSTNVMELIILDFPNLDIRKDIYGYDEEARRNAFCHLAKAMMCVLELPMLNWLKSSDHLLTSKEILVADVNDDPAFKELDEAGVVCSLIASTSKAGPSNT